MSVPCTAPQKQTSPLLLNPTIVNAPIRISRHGVGRPRAEDVSSRALLQNVAMAVRLSMKCHYVIIESDLNRCDMDQETRARVNENGRVVIPVSFRKALGINVGDEVVLRIEDDELRISTLKRRIERAQRLVRRHVKPGTSLVDELIAERREATRRE